MLAYLQNRISAFRSEAKLPKRCSFFIACICFSTFLQSCSHSAGRSSSQSNFFDNITGSSAYEDTFDKWTLTERTQSDFDLVLLANVTYWSPELRKAYVDEMSSTYRMSEEETKALAFEQRSEQESYFVFILSAYTRDPNWNDFNSETSIWRVSLENPDGNIRVRPKKMEKIPYKNEVAAYFYKHMDRYNETYKIYFEREKLKNSPALRFLISGPRGRLQFEFKQPVGSFVKANDLP